VVISKTYGSCSFSYSYTALAPRSNYTFPDDLVRAVLKGAAGINGRATYRGTRAGGKSSEGVLTGRLSVSFATLGVVRPLAGRLVHDDLTLRRAHGCLIGQLAGDSLGALVEFSSAAAIADKYPRGGPHQLADGGPLAALEESHVAGDRET